MYGYDSVRLRSSVVGSGEVVPSVMLSPKATKRTDDSTGTAETMTENPQAPDLPRLSVAVHVTRVVPRGNDVPDAGAHAVETGGNPAGRNRRVERHHGRLSEVRERLDVGRARDRRRRHRRVGVCRRPPAPGQQRRQNNPGQAARRGCRCESVEHVWFCHPAVAGWPAARARSDVHCRGLRSYTIAVGPRAAAGEPRCAPRRSLPCW